MPTQPTTRRTTQGYGANPRDYAKFGFKGHEGIDYATPNGDPAYNSKRGSVGIAQGNYGAYGTCVIIRTTEGEGLIYAHLQSFIVRPGQPVAEGQIIGYTDNTGNSTGPHLHFGYQPQYLQNLNNGYWGCADPAILFNQVNKMVSDSEYSRVVQVALRGIAEARRHAYMAKHGRLPTAQEYNASADLVTNQNMAPEEVYKRMAQISEGGESYWKEINDKFALGLTAAQIKAAAKDWENEFPGELLKSVSGGPGDTSWKQKVKDYIDSLPVGG